MSNIYIMSISPLTNITNYTNQYNSHNNENNNYTRYNTHNGHGQLPRAFLQQHKKRKIYIQVEKSTTNHLSILTPLLLGSLASDHI